MQGRQLAEVLLAVVAIWHLVGIIPSIAFLPAALSSQRTALDAPETFQVASLTASISLSVLVSCTLLIGRRRLAARLVPQNGPSPSPTPPWHAAAFAVLGVLFFVQGLSGAAPFLITAALGDGTTWELVSGDLVEAGLGLGLFFGAPGLAATWERLRRAGAASRAA